MDETAKAVCYFSYSVMNVLCPHNPPLSCYCGSEMMVFCCGHMVGQNNDGRKSLGPIPLCAESSSYFKIIYASYVLLRSI